MAEVRTCTQEFRDSAVRTVKEQGNSIPRPRLGLASRPTHSEARAAVFQRITIYYQRTPLHRALGHPSPAQFVDGYRGVR